MRRAMIAAAIAALSFASFAGCSDSAERSLPAPAPTASTASACVPSTATISWERATKAATVPIGVYVFRATAGDSDWKLEVHSTPASPVWHDEALGRIVTTDDGTARWRSALLASANRTRQVGLKFGEASSQALPERSPADPGNFIPQSFVVLVSTPQVTMPFTVRCVRGGAAITGTVTSSTFLTLDAEVLECGVDPGKDNDAAFIALSYCVNS